MTVIMGADDHRGCTCLAAAEAGVEFALRSHLPYNL